MYIKNSGNDSKIKAFDSCQSLCLTEIKVLFNRPTFLIQTRCTL
jgi:hypothetical protein